MANVKKIADKQTGGTKGRAKNYISPHTPPPPDLSRHQESLIKLLQRYNLYLN